MEWVLLIRSSIITPLFQYITWLGYSDFLFLFIPFCYWFCDRKIYSALPQFVFISALLNSFAKSSDLSGYTGFYGVFKEILKYMLSPRSVDGASAAARYGSIIDPNKGLGVIETFTDFGNPIASVASVPAWPPPTTMTS